MTGTYQLGTDPAHGLLRIKLAGFFDRETLERFAAEKAVAIASLGRAPNQHVTLCELIDCKLQAQDVVGAFARLIADPRSRARKLALVTDSPLGRMQLRRIIGDHARIFDTRVEAERWLVSGEAQEAA